MGNFDADTRVEPVGGGGASFGAQLSPDWEIWGPSGGYVAAILLRAAGARARIPRPAVFHCQFLRVARFGPVELGVEVVHAGRRNELLRASMRQGDKTIAEASLRTAAEGEGLEHDIARMPDVPGPDRLEDSTPLHGPMPFWRNIEPRCPFPEQIGPDRGPRDPAWVEWLRLRPVATFADPFLDAGRALALIDSFSWPAACGPHPGSAFRAPNLDVTAWFHRAEPESEWLLVDSESHIAGGGLMGTHTRVWSQTGRLVASGGAQLLCVPATG